METKRIEEEEIAEAGRILREGGLVAFPTDTVYGLGADAFNEEAVKRIFEVKGRANDSPLFLLIDSIEMGESLIEEFTDKTRALADAFWPGPLTIILNKNDKVSDLVTGGLKTVGIRIPDNPVARKLITLSKTPLAAPSANTSGRPSPTEYEAVLEDLDSKIEAVVTSSEPSYGLESTVVDLTKTSPVILRPGAISAEEIERVIGRVETLEQSPTTKYKHYSPKIPLILVTGEESEQEEKIKDFITKHNEVCVLRINETNFGVPSYYLGDNAFEWGKNFYKALRSLERSGNKVILAQTPKKSDKTTAFINRLEEASNKKI